MIQSNLSDTFATLRRFSSDFTQFGESYCCTHVAWRKFRLKPESWAAPLRLDGFFFILIADGEITIEINLENFVFKKNTFVFLKPGSLVRVLQMSDVVDTYMLYFSNDFVHEININFSVIAPTRMEKPTHGIDLDTEETQMMSRYVDLLKSNASTKVNTQIETYIASSIISAMIYQLILCSYKRLETLDGAAKSRPCRNAYVQDFIKLVHIHYAKERSVSFYADKLCISPKYLSLLVKETTGISAARWIDEFVLMEAKNLLRFSGKNVQQVAYALNFSNQSSFGKYFKHMTGMSPTEYQRS